MTDTERRYASSGLRYASEGVSWNESSNPEWIECSKLLVELIPTKGLLPRWVLRLPAGVADGGIREVTPWRLSDTVRRYRRGLESILAMVNNVIAIKGIHRRVQPSCLK